MDIGQAIKLLKAGKTMRRCAWSSERQYIRLQDEEPNLRKPWISERQYIRRTDYDEVSVEMYAPTQTDLLSDDWEEVA